MSLQTRKPLRMGGANFASGNPNTGELMFTRGGGQNACLWSGALAPSLAGCPAGAVTSGGNTMLFSGAGRLNSILPHALLTSGQPVFFYDSSIITVSGISVSGQKLIGFIPATYRAPLTPISGQYAVTIPWQDKIDCDMPFTSGLCVSAPSGAPGFTISFTPEVAYAAIEGN